MQIIHSKSVETLMYNYEQIASEFWVPCAARSHRRRGEEKVELLLVIEMKRQGRNVIERMPFLWRSCSKVESFLMRRYGGNVWDKCECGIVWGSAMAIIFLGVRLEREKLCGTKWLDTLAAMLKC